MFRLHNLELFGHPNLGHLNIDFRDNEVFIPDHEEPFTSVIIGMNGTGKSFVLKTIADIFHQIEKLRKSEKRDDINYAFYLKYSYDNLNYEICSSRWLVEKGVKKSRSDVGKVYVLLNRPTTSKLFKDDKYLILNEEYSISVKDVHLPWKVIASTAQVNDRFTFIKDDEISIYKYCGLKHTPRNISSNAFKRKITSSLLEAIGHSNFKDILNSTIVEFLGFDPYLSVNFRTKYTPRFYKDDLKVSDLEDFYIKYEEKQIRKTEPWGAWKFKQLLEDKNLSIENQTRLDDIIDYVKDLHKNDYLDPIKNSASKKLRIDFFSDRAYEIDYSIINDLIQLDILYVENIEIKKKGKDINLDQISAGENQIIMSLLRILSNIQEYSLVLIDEPELSLHPNWQMKYIHLLKKMFRKFPDSHFIIATHSHFLISDLKPNSSSVITLRRNEEGLNSENLMADTYGWSAEQVLYKVFEVRTTRNYYVEMNLKELLNLISVESQDYKRINELYRNLENVNLGQEDPLNKILSGARKYIDKL